MIVPGSHQPVCAVFVGVGSGCGRLLAYLVRGRREAVARLGVLWVQSGRVVDDKGGTTRSLRWLFPEAIAGCRHSSHGCRAQRSSCRLEADSATEEHIAAPEGVTFALYLSDEAQLRPPPAASKD